MTVMTDVFSTGTPKPAVRMSRSWAACIDHVSRFGSWWSRELTSFIVQIRLGWLIDGNRKRIAIDASRPDDGIDALVLTPSGRIARTVTAGTSSEANEKVSLAPGGVEMELLARVRGLVIPADLVFQRRIEVPRAVAIRFEAIAEDEMTRRTPFQLDRVFMKANVIPHPVDADKRLIRQQIVRRDLIGNICRKVGIVPGSLEFLAIRTDGTHIEIMELDQKAARSPAVWRKAISLLAALAIVLVAGNFGYTWWRQQNELADIESRIPAVREKAIAVREILNEIATRRTRVRAMFNRRAAPSMLQTWDEVTNLMPDTSWLTELSIDEGTLAIAGYADDATALVPLFAQSVLFENVAFTSPITLQGPTGVERFTITARIVQDNGGRRTVR